MKKPVRILHVIGGMNLGGAEVLCMNMYRNIDRNLFQFDFLVNRPGCFDEEIKKLGGRIYYIPALQKVGPLLYKKEVNNFFSEHNYQIIHSHLGQVSGKILELAKINNIPVRIAHSHTNSNKNNNILQRFYKSYLQKKINVNATHLLACSHEAAIWLYKEKSKDAKIVTNGIVTDDFKFSSNNRNDIRKRLQIDVETTVFGHVSRFNKVKNHLFLLKIFYWYNKINKDSKLILIGDGEMRCKIEKKICKLNLKDNVILLGSIENPKLFYNVFDIFVFPSKYEGLGISLIEAQCNGLPCYTSKKVVSLECNVSGKVKFIPLKYGAKKWAEIILKENKKRFIKELNIDEFDIKSTVLQMMNIYSSKI